jgi:UDP-MurNAc hydroxylase
MKVRYIYSACVVIESEDLTLCCDPWFTPGIYYGSWYQYPPLPKDPVDVIGKVDAIYVSHVHPDHYDIDFLRRYLDRFPDTQIIIGETDPPYLLRQMKSDGLNPTVVSETQYGDTCVNIIANQAYEYDNIDTALVVTRKNLSVANMNDNPFDKKQIQDVLSLCPTGRPTVALLPFAGAGPYPQTYELPAEEALEAATRKRKQFLVNYSNFLENLNPLKAIPFAGQYFLGGPLKSMNDHRGVPDAPEVPKELGDTSVVLEDGGQAYIDLETLDCSAVRTETYDPVKVRRHLNEIPFKGMAFENEINQDEANPDGLLELAQKSYVKAIAATKVEEPFWICLKPDRSEDYIAFDTCQDNGVSALSDVSHLQPRCEIFLDDRFLLGLLDGRYLWSIAEVGSQYRVKRVPNIYKREVYSFLNRLHV